jgi:HSP20 family molecular chaperone IbpA
VEARELFERQITSIYDGEPSHLGELIFHADQGDGVPPVHHLGLCDDASAAGEYFNTRNITHLMQMLENGDALGSNIVLSDCLSDEIQRLMPIFVNIESADGGTGTMDGNDGINQQIMAQYKPVEEVVPASEEGYQVAGTVELQPPGGSCLAMKKHGVISSLGDVIAHDVSFDPLVNVFDQKIDNKDHRVIQIECPRVTEEDIQWEDIPNGVKVNIQKAKAFDEAKIKKVYPLRQHFGIWEREFAFSKEEGRFERVEEEQVSLKNGVLTLLLPPANRKIGRLARIQESTQFVPPPPTSDDGMQAASSFHAHSYVIPPTVPSSVCSESTEMSC